MAARRSTAAALALGAAVLCGGCSHAVDGTPVAAPGEIGVGASGGDLLATTCREYTAMKDSARREVVLAIGEDNPLVSTNPEIWMGVAAALCTFADPGAPVKDVITGGIR